MRSYVSFYFDAFKLAVQAIFAHKLRAFLTLIGIIIGVASVVVVGASINGLNAYVLTTVSKMLGANHFMIARIAVNGRLSEEEWEKMNRRNKRLYLDDFEWLKERCKQCAEVGVDINTRVKLNYEGQEMLGTQALGVSANMGVIENKDIGEGRFISESEEKNSALVTVIGADVRDKFFQGADPVGKELKVQGCPLRIVGVETRRGSMFGSSLDNNLYMPITTFGHIFGRRQSIRLHGSATQQEQFNAAMDEARQVMRNRHKLVGNEEDDFGLVNTGDIKNQVDQFTGTIALVVTPVTLLSLLVGGIVVMNIMLVSVTERTFEIGLRKAVGARRGQILLQFMIESALLSSVGGMLGLLLASAIAWAVKLNTPIPMVVTAGYILLALAVSGGIGMIAGIYPAFKASRLDPIVALSKS
ncbi:MAG: ABC transporter permease [Acidobacteria bacterium]|nr:ABC transporter permease [Acidobacteriota bacterium]MBI3426840.1 ABC transporter permease [Acidobacteriota bacterium]